MKTSFQKPNQKKLSTQERKNTCEDKSELSAGKVSGGIFWNYMYTLLIDYLRVRCNIDDLYYYQFLDQSSVDKEARFPRWKNETTSRQCSTSHTQITREKLAEIRWKSMQHPPCDFRYFGHVKEAMGDKHFENNEGMEAFVTFWRDLFQVTTTRWKIFRFNRRESVLRWGGRRKLKRFWYCGVWENECPKKSLLVLIH